MKHKLSRILAAGVALLAAAASLVVYAYIQDVKTKENKFLIGEDRVTVAETFVEPTVMHTTDTFTKQVTVQNTGTSDQFVRVYLDFSDSTVRDKCKLKYTWHNEDNDEPMTTGWSDFLTHLPQNWVYVPTTGDLDSVSLGGYFYYTKILHPANSATDPATPAESTTPLIEEILTNFSGSPIKAFDVIVYSEAIQTVETGTGVAYDQWRDAWKSFLRAS